MVINLIFTGFNSVAILLGPIFFGSIQFMVLIFCMDFLSKFSLGSNYFLSNFCLIFFVGPTFLRSKFCWSKKLFGSKLFWSWTVYGPKKFSGLFFVPIRQNRTLLCYISLSNILFFVILPISHPGPKFCDAFFACFCHFLRTIFSNFPHDLNSD